VLDIDILELAITATVANIQRFKIDDDANVQQNAALQADRSVFTHGMDHPGWCFEQPIPMD
jgi:hypothetical protein